MAPRNNPSPTSDGEHPVRDLLTIVGILLAALQVVPMYFTSSGPKALGVSASIAFCAITFLYLRYASRISDTWRRRLWLLGLLLGLAGYIIYSQVSLRAEIAALRLASASKAGDTKLREYLEGVVKEHSSQWNGEFEKKYARPTLYQLSETGVKAMPTDVQKSILLWRSGSEGVSTHFMGVASLAGETLPNATKDLTKTAGRFMDYVLRPMADSDLLNKRTKEPQNGLPSDDVPQRMLILGDPAAGKSTMLERLDMIQARRALGSSTEAIPVLVRLKGMRQPSKELLIEKLRERLGANADTVFQTRSLVLFIDALDESEDPIRAAEAIVEVLETGPFAKGVDRVIVTCRLFNYTTDLHTHPAALHFKQFSTAILFGLDQTAIEKQILGSPFTRDQKIKVMEKLANTNTRAAWLQFLRMPMNFDLISEIMGELDTNDISKGQTEIIRRFVNYRFAQKGMSAADANDARKLLERASLNLLKEGVSVRSREFGVKDTLPDSQPGGGGDDNDEQSLKGVEERLVQIETAGLIRRRGPGQYRFFHLNLQDYFTAMALSDVSQIDPTQAAWRQIILFFAGRVDGGSILPVLEDAKVSKLPKIEDEKKRQDSTAALEDLRLQVSAIRANVSSSPEL